MCRRKKHARSISRDRGSAQTRTGDIYIYRHMCVCVCVCVCVRVYKYACVCGHRHSLFSRDAYKERIAVVPRRRLPIAVAIPILHLVIHFEMRNLQQPTPVSVHHSRFSVRLYECPRTATHSDTYRDKHPPTHIHTDRQTDRQRPTHLIIIKMVVSTHIPAAVHTPSLCADSNHMQTVSF